MRIVKDGLWWKPFSTFINCSNVHGGDCIPDISVDECIQKCENDDGCQMGYHVHFKNTNQKYCVPVSTVYQWGNETPLISLIPSKNPTLLSTDKNIEWTGFYNEKRYPSFPELPKDFFTFIFSGMRVYLRTLDTHYYLTETGFTPNKMDATVIIISPAKASVFDPNQRINFNDVVSIFKNNTFLHLKYYSKNNYFSWQPVYNPSTKTFFTFIKCNDDKNTFINHLTPFYLNIHYNNLFLSISEKDELIADPSRKTCFVFEIDFTDPYNKYRENQFRYSENADKTNPVFVSTFSDYICQEYQCYPIFETVTIKNLTLMIELLTIILIILLLLLRSTLK